MAKSKDSPNRTKKTTRSSSKLGRNPFESSKKSQVGRMIEASFSKTSTDVGQKLVERSFFERLQDMHVAFDLKELLKTVKDRAF